MHLLLALFLSAHAPGTHGLRVEGGIHGAGPYIASAEIVRDISGNQTLNLFADYRHATDGIFFYQFTGFGIGKSWVMPISPSVGLFYSGICCKLGASHNVEGADGVDREYSEWTSLMILETVNETYLGDNFAFTFTVGARLCLPTEFSPVSGFVRAGIGLFL
jgi:hypothetical protein